MQTLKDLLNGNAERYAEKPAFLGARRNYTFREVNERINCLNHALVSLGVRKGDRVGILACNCPQCFEVFGLAKAGRIAVPLNFRSVGRELAYLIQNAGLHTLIVEREFVPVIDSIRSEIAEVPIPTGTWKGR